MQTVNRYRSRAHAARCAMLAAASLAALLVGGCGIVDGVELQGGVFDALGVSTAEQEKNKRTEPKVAARPGIILPPGENRLPPPGAPPLAEELHATGSGEAWPVEPETNKARAKAELEKKHKEFCETALRNARMTGQATNTVQGPMGSCQPSVFSGVSSMFGGTSK